MPLLSRALDELGAATAGWGVEFLRLGSPKELVSRREEVQDCDVFASFGGLHIDSALLQSSRLRGLVSFVSGTEGYPVAAATNLGIIIAHAPTPENVQGMAEAALLLMLHLSYDLDAARDDLRSNLPRPAVARGRLLCRRTIGLVGYGRIAQRLVELLAPWGMRVLVASRRGTDIALPPHASACDLDTLLSESDVICVLAGAEANAPPLIGRLQIAKMKPSAHLVNVARGSLVDEIALTEALSAGSIAGAALDVFAVEPLPHTSPLRAVRNAILTPHRLGHTRELEASLPLALIRNVSFLLEGRVPPMVRNPAAVPNWLVRWGDKPLIPLPLAAAV